MGSQVGSNLHTHTHTHINKQSHTQTQAYKQTHAQKQEHITYTCKHKHTHTITCTHNHTHTITRTHNHTPTQSHAHTITCTHNHIHVQLNRNGSVLYQLVTTRQTMAYFPVILSISITCITSGAVLHTSRLSTLLLPVALCKLSGVIPALVPAVVQGKVC